MSSCIVWVEARSERISKWFSVGSKIYAEWLGPNYQKSLKNQNLQLSAWFLFLLSQKSNLFWVVLICSPLSSYKRFRLRLSALRLTTSVFKRFISSFKAWFEASSKEIMNHERHSHKNLPQTESVRLHGYILLSFWISNGDISLLTSIPFPVILSVMIGCVKRPLKVPS